MEETTNSDQSTGKIDRRKIRTRSALREALNALIQEKEYDAITVEEIAQRADVGRATFYKHFKDKEDLLLEQVSELAHDRVQLLSEIPLTGWDAEFNPPYLPLLFIFKNASENASLYRAVLHGEGAARVTARLRDIIFDALDAMMHSHDESGELTLSTTVPIDFLARYLAGALVGSITWWLDQPEELDPIEMTRLFQHMFFPGAIRIFGISTE
jgi:AcrR family transcriptional regulator